MDGINEIIDNLTDEDIGRLKNLANDLFGSTGKSQTSEKPKSGKTDMFDPATLNRIMNIISAMKSETGSDDRTNFISSLKPLLSDKRQQKADEAVKMMHLFDILPALKDSGIF